MLLSAATPSSLPIEVILEGPDDGTVAASDTPTPPFQAFQTSDTNRWSSTATNVGGLQQGDPTTLTWSIVPDGTSINGYNGEPTSDSNLLSFLGGIYGVTTNDSNYADEPWFPIFEDIFARWSELTGITYVYEPHDDGSAWTSFSIASGQLGVRGDMRISGHYIDGESGSNVLAYNFFPGFGDMVIDTGNPTFFGNTSNNSLGIRNVLTHEHGHGIGLSHVESNNAAFLMEPFINLGFDGPQYDDILGAQRLYGDRLESPGNETPATATPLGTIAGSSVTIGADATTTVVAANATDFVSIDDDSDVDVYSFTTTAFGTLNLTLTPVGPTYNQGPQGGSQSSFNASAQSDLVLQLIDVNGTTVLRTADLNGVGGGESINMASLPAGTYYARITGKANLAQTYTLSVAASGSVIDDHGNSFATATSVGVPSPTAGNLEIAGDVDYFSFVAVGGAEYRLSTVLGTLGDSTLTLYDVDGVTQLAFNDDSGGQASLINWTAPADGTYFLKVAEDGNDASGTYSLDAAIVDDFANDHAGAATVADPSSTAGVIEVLGDRDVFRFDAVAGREYSIATNLGTLGDSLITLYDTNGTTVITSDHGSGSAGGSLISWTAPTTGAYFLEVQAFADASVGTYMLDLSSTAPPIVPVIQIVDDADAGFSKTGSWALSGGGYPATGLYANAGGGKSATFSFTDLTPGRYQVSGTWRVTSVNATDVPYSFFDVPGGTKFASTAVNQLTTPDDFSDAGGNWENVAVVNVTGTTLAVQLTNDGSGRVFADAVRIERIGDLPIGPEIDVFDGSTPLVDGVSNVEVASTKTFTVRNNGTGDLVLQPVTFSGSGVEITSNFTAGQVVLPNQEATFSIQTTSSSASGTLSIPNSDSDENPFEIGIAPPPSVRIIDDGDLPGFSTVGSWGVSGGGFESDTRYTAEGGGKAATWDFGELTPGQYLVSTSWRVTSVNATDAPYAILDGVGGSVLLETTVNQRIAADDRTADGTGFEDLGLVNVSGTTLAVVLSNTANGRVFADAVRIERIGNLPAGAEIEEFDGSTPLVDGVSTVEVATTKTFTVRNNGTADLIVQPATFSGTGFSIIENVVANQVIAPNQTAEITVQLTDPNGGGILSLASNDIDENPFDVTLAPPPSVRILDDGDVGFSTMGNWAKSGGGYQTDTHYANAGDGEKTAVWTFDDLLPGDYTVAVSWRVTSANATNAPYTILDSAGGNVLASAVVNQSVPADDLTDQGTNFEILATVTVSNGTLVVQLNDLADGRVFADALRVERIG